MIGPWSDCPPPKVLFTTPRNNKCQDELGMFRISLVAAMCYTRLPNRRHMLRALEKPGPTFQEARPETNIFRSLVPTWIRDSVPPPQC